MDICDKYDEKMANFADDDFRENEKEEFLNHISSCPKCKNRFEEAKKIKQELLQITDTIEVDKDFAKNVIKKAKESKKSIPYTRYIRRFGALAACIIAVVFVSKADFNNINLIENNEQKESLTVNEKAGEKPGGEEMLVQEKKDDTKQETASKVRSIQPDDTKKEETGEENTKEGRISRLLPDDTKAPTEEIELTQSEMIITVKEADYEKTKNITAKYGVQKENGISVKRAVFYNIMQEFTENEIVYESQGEITEDEILFIIKTK